MRLSPLIVAAILGLGTLPAQAQAPRVKPDVLVDGEFVRLSDLIENVDPTLDAPVFKAPELGATGTIQVVRVLAAAREHELNGVDDGGVSAVVVRRTGRLVAVAEIRSAVRDTLTERFSLPAGTQLSFDPGLRPFVVESAAGSSVVTNDVVFNQRSGRFDAQIGVPGSAISERLALRVTGSAGDTAMAPVFKRNLRRGDIVQADDVGYEKVRRADIAGDTIFDQQRIIGMSVTNPAKAGDLVRESDLSRPTLVERGGLVTLVYQTAGISLTVKGKALTSGSEGDLVSVQNTSSKKVIEGRVVGAGRVSVQGFGSAVTTASADR